MTDNPIGIYLHIPFCAKKCSYCDFYSAFKNDALMEKYVNRLISEINMWGGKLNRPTVNTVYFGGGTPSLLKGHILPIMTALRNAFFVLPDSEITLELNPAEDSGDMLEYAVKAGVNRLSVGAQSGDNEKLKLLGRTHNAEATVNAVNKAREKGINNITLDLMIALPDSDTSSLKADLDYILSMKPDHISSYILKIEENTYFNKIKDSLRLPDEDNTAEQYLFMCRYLGEKGYNHYEISNFSRNGAESRHNLKYWSGEEYLGIGPSAHSFLNGKRFYYPRDIKAFLNTPETVPDGNGGNKEEYIMLRLRLKEGLNFVLYSEKYGEAFPDSIKISALPLKDAGLLSIDNDKISLTDSGMLVSNSIISLITEEL